MHFGLLVLKTKIKSKKEIKRKDNDLEKQNQMLKIFDFPFEKYL